MSGFFISFAKQMKTVDKNFSGLQFVHIFIMIYSLDINALPYE